MPSFLHHLSAWLFYTLGISFFVAYMLVVNQMWTPWPSFWISVADLPLLLAGMLYGGTSVYLSLKNPETNSPFIALGIILPLAAIFLGLVVMNFWPILS